MQYQACLDKKCSIFLHNTTNIYKGNFRFKVILFAEKCAQNKLTDSKKESNEMLRPTYKGEVIFIS